MKSYQEYLEERFINLTKGDERMHDYKHEVHGLLQKAYAPIGGIHGSGFKDADDMTKNVDMWKLHKHQGKVKVALMYKEKNGRKRVAVATDGSDHAKQTLARMVQDDLHHERSWGEVSGPSLKFLKRNLPEGHLNKVAMTHDQVKKVLGKDEEIRKPPVDDPEIKLHPELADHFYQRKIGDEWHTKLSIGHPGKTIYSKK